jgi:hypothetical protein
MSFLINSHRFGAGGAPPADPIAGVLATRITSSTTTSPVPWNSEEYDYTGWHDNSTNPSRLTVPSGASLVRASFCLHSADATTGGMQLNGAAFRGRAASRCETGGSDAAAGISAPFAVSAGQYIEITNGSGETVDASAFNWGAVEVLDPSLRYALVYKSGTQALSANTNTTLTFDSETADVGGWHDTVTNNSRLTVPVGVTLARITANVETGSFSGQGVINCTKNGAGFAGGFARDTSLGSGNYYMNGVSAVLVVTAGDYFEFQVLTAGASTVQSGEYTWFAIEEVPSSVKRCLCTLDVSQAIAGGVDEALVFTAEVYDTDAIHDNASNQSFFTAPAGVTEARISFNVQGPNAAINLFAYVTKNGSVFYGSTRCESDTTASDSVNGITAWVPCSPGDDFEVWAAAGSGITIAAGNQTWVCAEFR